MPATSRFLLLVSLSLFGALSVACRFPLLGSDRSDDDDDDESGGGFDGEVDGKSLGGVLSSSFIQMEDVDSFSVLVSGIPLTDECGREARYAEERRVTEEKLHDDLMAAVTDEEVADAWEAYATALSALANERLPKDFWGVSVWLFGEDDGDIDGDFNLLDEPAGFNVCFHEGDYDYDAQDLTDRNLECFRAGAGTVTVESFERSSTIAISGEDMEMVDDDGNAKGLIESFTLTADHCQGWQAAQDDLEDIWSEE